MYQKFKERKPYELLNTSKYPPEVSGRFNSFITTQFDDSLSVEMQMRSIIKWAIDNFKEMDDTYNDFTTYIIQGNLNPFIEFLNDLIEYMNEFVEAFDENYQETILDKMQEWYDNGELESFINESLDTKYHEMDNRLTSQMTQTTDLVTTANLNTMGKAPKKTKPLVTFVTDDATVQDYTIFKDLFAKYDIGCSTAVVTNRPDNSDYPNAATKQQLKELQDDYGWEIISHTTNHPRLTNLTDEELDDTLKQSKDWLRENGFHGHDFLMYPFGDFDERVKRFTAKYYRGARTTNGIFNQLPISSYELATRFFSETVEVDTILDDIERIKETGEWLIIFFHSWEIDEWDRVDDFDQLVANVASQANMGNIEIVNFQEGFDKLGNTIDQASNRHNEYGRMYEDHFVLSEDGKVSSNIGKTKVIERNSVSSQTPPKDFDVNFQTICTISGANGSGFPNNAPGTLVTTYFTSHPNEPTNALYAYQEFHEYNNKSGIYKRIAKNQDEWWEWVKISTGEVTTYYRHLQGFDGTSQPSSFPKDQTVFTTLSNAGAKQGGIPVFSGEAFGGLLTTTIMSNDIQFSYQTFVAYNSNQMFVRKAESANSWSVWSRVTPLTQSTTQRNNESNDRFVGDCVFDTTLNQPIWWTGENWVDANGSTV